MAPAATKPASSRAPAKQPSRAVTDRGVRSRAIPTFYISSRGHTYPVSPPGAAISTRMWRSWPLPPGSALVSSPSHSSTRPLSFQPIRGKGASPFFVNFGLPFLPHPPALPGTRSCPRRPRRFARDWRRHPSSASERARVRLLAPHRPRPAAAERSPPHARAWAPDQSQRIGRPPRRIRPQRRTKTNEPSYP